MERREVLKRSALLLGIAITAPTAMAVLNGCKASPVADDWQPLFFSKEEGNLLGDIADRIIPETDTPGAKAAGVHKFMDEAVFSNFPSETQNLIKQKVSNFSKDCMDKFGKSFTKLTDEEKDDFLKIQESAAVKFNESNNNDQDFHLWDRMKEMTVAGYMGSEIGATQFLKIDPIPGEYKACIDLSEVGGTWAL